MSVQTQIDRISGNVSAALSAIAAKGVTVPDGSTSDALAELILSIEAGGGGSIAFGSFIPAEDCSYYEITHNLGKVPDFACCFTPCGENGSWIVVYDDGSERGCTFKSAGGYLNGTTFPSYVSYLHKTKTGKYASDSSMFNATENTVCVGNNASKLDYLLSTVKYFWIVWVNQ